jgi:hypothetical protein
LGIKGANYARPTTLIVAIGRLVNPTVASFVPAGKSGWLSGINCDRLRAINVFHDESCRPRFKPVQVRRKAVVRQLSDAGPAMAGAGQSLIGQSLIGMR